MGDLTTLALVKAYANITGTDSGRDAVLEDLIDGASAQMENYLHRIITSATYTSEKIDGNHFTDSLILKNYPVTTFTSLTENGVAVSAATFDVDMDAGIIYRVAGSWWTSDGVTAGWISGRRIYAATYIAGYTAVPEDLANACARQVILEWKRSGIKGDRIGLVTTQLSDGSTATYSKDAWAEGVQEVLDQYRRVM